MIHFPFLKRTIFEQCSSTQKALNNTLHLACYVFLLCSLLFMFLSVSTVTRRTWNLHIVVTLAVA